MRMLRWTRGNTLRATGNTNTGRIRNEGLNRKLETTSVVDKMRENQLKWFDHMQRMPVSV